MRTVRRQPETLPGLLDDIDARNSCFSGIARIKCVSLPSRNRHIDGHLQRLIDAMETGEAPFGALGFMRVAGVEGMLEEAVLPVGRRNASVRTRAER